MAKAMYEILDSNSVHICYQVATSGAEALHLAKTYYGHERDAFARRVDHQ